MYEQVASSYNWFHILVSQKKQNNFSPYMEILVNKNILKCCEVLQNKSIYLDVFN